MTSTSVTRDGWTIALTIPDIGIQGRSIVKALVSWGVVAACGPVAGLRSGDLALVLFRILKLNHEGRQIGRSGQ